MSDSIAVLTKVPQRIGETAAPGGMQLKESLVRMTREAPQEVIDFGNQQSKLEGEFPDFIVPMVRAIGRDSRRIGLPLLLNNWGEIPQWSACVCAAYSRGRRGKHLSPGPRPKVCWRTTMGSTRGPTE